MATRGTEAKINVINKIKEAFKEDFIGEFDKKIYVYADDGGERVQIAIALTCPKNMVETVNTSDLNYNTGRDFSNNTIIAPPGEVEITEEEKENVRKLMASMGL